MSELVTYLVTAVIPLVDGTEEVWQFEVPSFSGPEAACRRALYALMAQGSYEPLGTPEEAMRNFSAEVMA